MHKDRSECALILAPRGRDAEVAKAMLAEEGIEGVACTDVPDVVARLNDGVGFVIATEEALAGSDLRPLSDFINHQPEWSDLPFVLLTSRGGGLERNLHAGRFLELRQRYLRRAAFTSNDADSVARARLRGRGRQYDARARLERSRQPSRA